MAAAQKEIISCAREAFASGKTLPLSFRIKQLKNMIKMLDENRQDILDALYADIRKCKTEGILFEIEPLRSDLHDQIRNLRSHAKDAKLPFNLMTFDEEGIVKRDPYGLVLILGAWNYPLMLSLQPVAGAIAAGNCVILKPSEISPHSAGVMAELVRKYLDNECYHVIEAELEETKLLLTNPFDYIFATGSVVMGKAVMATAAQHLTPVTLELGGKSPCYVDENSDIEVATKRILWGKLMNLGQTCIAPDYVLCSKKVEKIFVNAASKIISKWFGQNPQQSPDLSRIVNTRNFLRLKKILDNTSGQIVIGGQSDENDRWIAPTILNDSVMEDEIFGPILPILTVNNHEEAIQFILSRPKPLALYIFAKSNKVVKKFLDRTSSGGVCVNDVLLQIATEGLPFGGVGNSGMGRYHGKYSYETFSHPKAILRRGFNQGLALLNLVAELSTSARYPPYNDHKIAFLRTMMRILPYFNVNLGGLVTHVLAILFGVALVFLCQYLLS